MFTLLGFATFCLISLESPDSLLLGEQATINLPFVGQISFTSFLLMGPALLLGIRFYLHLLVTHQKRIEAQLTERGLRPWPTPVPRQHPFIKAIAGFVLYILVPLTMLDFTWKALALPEYGVVMAIATAATIWMHLVFALGMHSPSRIAVNLSIALVLAIICYPLVSAPDDFRRPLNLFRADLAGAFLAKADLRNAYASRANFEGAVLIEADLRGARFSNAMLRHADFHNADLTGAEIKFSDSSGADFTSARMSPVRILQTNMNKTNLVGADLGKADFDSVSFEGANLHGANLEGANIGNSLFTDADMTDANLDGVLVDALYRRHRLEYATKLSEQQRQQLTRAAGAQRQRQPIYGPAGNIIGFDEDKAAANPAEDNSQDEPEPDLWPDFSDWEMQPDPEPTWGNHDDAASNK